MSFMRISKNTIYSICISIGFIIFAFIINVYLGFIILLSFLPALPTFVRKKDNDPAQAVYTRKDFLTYNEKLFYRKLLPLSNDYIIIPQVNLAQLFKKKALNIALNYLEILILVFLAKILNYFYSLN